MYTPRGFDPRTPAGVSPPPDKQYLGTYQVAQPGPFAGIIAAHVRGIVSKEGRVTAEVYGALGADVDAAGKAAQDFIHRRISNSPLFPWPDDTQPFAELGVGKTLTIQDVGGRQEFDNHLEFGWDAVTGTRRTEATVKGTFFLESAIWHTELGDFHLEWSLGGIGRAFIRYNDGRPSTEMGVEAGFKYQHHDHPRPSRNWAPWRRTWQHRSTLPHGASRRQGTGGLWRHALWRGPDRTGTAGPEARLPLGLVWDGPVDYPLVLLTDPASPESSPFLNIPI